MSKIYTVKEIYYTLQGEGAHTGRPAVFCRFSGCNLWTGREEDRAKAVCNFCDTDFVGTDGINGGKYSAEELVIQIRSLYPGEDCFVVCTGGEPALQLDEELVNALHDSKIEVAIETNGTLDLPIGLDWITVSPKADSVLKITSGKELKLVFPQEKVDPSDFIRLDFEQFYLQPMDGPRLKENIKETIAYILANPKWKLSLQTHKELGIA